MIVAERSEQDAKKVTAPGFEGASMQAMVGPKQGWEGHVMRMVTLEPGGHTSRHAHPWPHINYVSRGEGILFLEGQEHPLREGSYAQVPSNAEHQFINTGAQRLEFICIVPEEGHQ